ncbi:MAG: iron-containing alcohol dehydrogenase [Desulfobacterales bacterium]|nr:iron-containing alcohol dehydrogenase [Desulfobacterales bacterium]
MASLVRESGYKRPLLITGATLLKRGHLDNLLSHFETEGLQVAIFDGIPPNPTDEVIRDGVKAVAQSNCDCLFVVGGGSAIDAAKVIAACCTNNFKVENAVGLLKVKTPTLPCYVAPTTSGTGSEVTNAAVISDSRTHQKKFVIDPKLIPMAAALDPLLLKSLPQRITAETGMDALTHAIEAYTSLNQFSDAERDAELAVKLLIRHLPRAYENGDNLESREWVAMASFLAGAAFNKSGLGYVHAISHQISAHYNTSHGLANAVLLTRVMRFNKPACAHRLAALERILGGEASGDNETLADQFIERIEKLSDQIGIPRKIEGIKSTDLDTITTNALREAKWSYAVPRLMNRAACNKILMSMIKFSCVMPGSESPQKTKAHSS